MSEIISQELDYSSSVNNHSTVVFRNVSPQSSSTVTTSTSSLVGPTEFLISPSVFNPAKSRLNFQIQASTGAWYNPSQSATAYGFINANTVSSIGRIVLYDSATNAVWADISNVEKYAALVIPSSTHIDDYLSKSFVTAAYTDASVTSALSQPFPVEDISKVNAVAAAANYTCGGDTGATSIDASVSNAYFARKQWYVGHVTSSSATASLMFLDVSIPFSAFKFSSLATDKNLYCPSNLVLQIYWNANTNYAMVSDAIATPGTTSRALNSAYPFVMANVSLQLANEGNLSIVSQVIDKVMKSGLEFAVGYPTVTRQSISSTTAHSYSLQLTRGYGDRILGLITAPFFNTTATQSHANAHSRGYLTTYNTFINNVALKYPAGYDCSKGQDYTVANKQYLRNSTIQNISDYAAYEWLHCDSFFGEKPLCEVNQHSVDGLDVGAQSATWQIQATTSTAIALVWVTCIIGQKVVKITSQGSMLY